MIDNSSFVGSIIPYLSLSFFGPPLYKMGRDSETKGLFPTTFGLLFVEDCLSTSGCGDDGKSNLLAVG